MLNYQMVVHTDCNIVELGIALNKNMQTSQPNIQTVWPLHWSRSPSLNGQNLEISKKNIRIIQKKQQISNYNWFSMCRYLGFSMFQNPHGFFRWSKPHNFFSGSHQINGHATGSDWLEVPIPYIRPIQGLCKGIPPQNMAKNMVQYLRFRILKISHWSNTDVLKGGSKLPMSWQWTVEPDRKNHGAKSSSGIWLVVQ